MVAGSRGVQAVEAFHGKTDRGIETERHHRLVQVIVNRFWHAHHPQSLFNQGIGNGHRAVTAN